MATNISDKFLIEYSKQERENREALLERIREEKKHAEFWMNAYIELVKKTGQSL